MSRKNVANYQTFGDAQFSNISIQSTGVGLTIYGADSSIPVFTFDPITKEVNFDSDVNITGSTTTSTINVSEFDGGLFGVAATNIADVVDLGLSGKYINGVEQYTGIARIAGDVLKRWTFFDYIATQPVTTINGNVGPDQNQLASVRANFIYLNDGTASLPSIVFDGNATKNTGFYRIGTDNIGISTSGVNRIDIGNTRTNFVTGGIINIGTSGTTSPLNVFGLITGTNGITISSGTSSLQDVTAAGVVSITNNTTSTTTTTGALVITGGLGVGGAIFGTTLSASGIVSITNSTTSTTTTTGALVITGGLGVGGAIFGTTLSASGVVSITNSTASTTTTTGALVITGGLGVGGAIFGTTLTASGLISGSSGLTISSGTSSLQGITSAGLITANAGLNVANSQTLNVGTSGTTSPLNVYGLISARANLELRGSSSGIITIQPQAAAGTYNFNLPTTSGTAGQFLTSGGGGSTAMTWSQPGSFTSTGSTTISNSNLYVAPTSTAVAAASTVYFSSYTAPATTLVTGAVTNAYTIYVAGAPTISGGGTITNTWALFVASGATSLQAVTTAGQVTSTVTTGTAPFVITSTTNVANLNASTLSGATFASPGAIGGTVASTGAFTTLSASGNVSITSVTASTTTGTGALVITGGLGVGGAIFVGGIVSALCNVNGVPTSSLYTRNTNNGSSAYSLITVQNDTANSCNLFLNSNARTADGGINTATLRNDAGALRLQNGSSQSTILLSGTTTSITSSTTSTTTATGALVITGGLGVGNYSTISGFSSLPASGANSWHYLAGNVNGVNITGTNSGIAFGWNASASQGESIMTYYTGSGGNPRLAFCSWDGTTRSERVSINAAGTLTTGAISATSLTTPTISPSGLLTIAPAGYNAAHTNLNGAFFKINNATFNETTTIGLLSDWVAINLGQATFGITGPSPSIMTNGHNVYIPGPVLNGTNMTITNRWALTVASGNSLFGGNVTHNGFVTMNANAEIVNSSPTFTIRNSSNGSGSLYLGNSAHGITRSGNNDVILYTTGASTIIQSGGRAMITCSNITRMTTAADNFQLTANGSGDQLYVTANGFSSANGYFYYNAGNNFGTISDRRIKTNINNISLLESETFIRALNPVSFEIKKSKGNSIQCGFIAQEVLEACTNNAQRSAINKWETYNENDPDCPLIGVSDRPIIANLVGALKSAFDKIDSLTQFIQSKFPEFI